MGDQEKEALQGIIELIAESIKRLQYRVDELEARIKELDKSPR